MADLQVYLLHPTTGRRQRARVDDSMTADEVIQDLEREGFVKTSPNGYQLAVKGGSDIRGDQTLRAANVRQDDVLQVLPISHAGERSKELLP